MQILPHMANESLKPEPHAEPPLAEPLAAGLPPSPPPILLDGIPNWDAITFDVFCSRCEYNLRTLTRPRCPECGLEFEWQDALDWRSRASDYLFEYNWRQKPMRSWLWTTWRSLRPRRFWTEVSMHDRVHAGPLWFVLVFSIINFLIVLHVTAALGWLACEGLAQIVGLPKPTFGRAPGVANVAFTMLDACRFMLLEVARLPLRDLVDYLMGPAAIAAYLGAALALLCSLRQTIGRCKLRTIHMVRALAYTATPVLALFALFTIAVDCVFSASSALQLPPPYFDALALVFIVPLAVFTYYLAIAMKHHVRLPHPWLLAGVTTLVATLFTMTAAVVFSVWQMDGYG